MLKSCTILALSIAASSVTGVYAQTFPSRPARIIVGFTAGGATDVTARLLAQDFTKMWGQQVLVDNRPGASGMIGAELVARAAPDGHTLLVSPQTSIVVAPLLIKKVAYDSLKDFATVAVVGSTPQLLVIHPSLPPKNFKEFVAFVKANAKNLSFGSGGIGSTPHMAGELFNASPDMKERMLKQGIDQNANNTPEKHAAYVKAEFARWGKVIRDAGIKIE